ncbi:MAG: 16S rRNA (cytosine(1402)-N(4))-methyltransferase RsmH [Chloroflexota bacterium]
MVAASHVPVLLEETIQALAVQPGGRYIDATLGGGGHAALILERSVPGGQLLGIDADPEAIKSARERLSPFGNSVLIINDNFANLEAICFKYDFLPVHGILFDLGLSSLQLESERGFSFQRDAALDMRFSPTQRLTAADIVNRSPERELASLIRDYGEEPFSREIARHIVKKRPLRTTLELTRVIEEAVRGRRGRIHPATRTFQALRIAVNHELENLQTALEQAVDLLGFGGRLVVLSYHSLEDRIVKQFLRRESRDCICPPGVIECTCGHRARLRIITRKAVVPTPEEIERNPRSRSVKLRAAERVISEAEYHEQTQENRSYTEANCRGWRRPSLLRKLKIAFAA